MDWHYKIMIENLRGWQNVPALKVWLNCQTPIADYRYNTRTFFICHKFGKYIYSQYIYSQ